jgi:hypothetical protein
VTVLRKNEPHCFSDVSRLEGRGEACRPDHEERTGTKIQSSTNAQRYSACPLCAPNRGDGLHLQPERLYPHTSVQALFARDADHPLASLVLGVERPGYLTHRTFFLLPCCRTSYFCLFFFSSAYSPKPFACFSYSSFRVPHYIIFSASPVAPSV